MTYHEVTWFTQSTFPVLAALQVWPLLALVLVWLTRNRGAVFYAGLAGVIVELVLAVYLYAGFDSASGSMQFAERIQFAGPFQYHAAADGMTVLFVLLSAILSLLVVLYGRIRPLLPAWRFLATVFVTEATLISQFVAVDMLWFTLVSAVQLFVVGQLLWFWATSPDKDLALNRYQQFMTLAVILLLAGTVMLGWNHADLVQGRWSFDLYDLARSPIQAQYQSVIFFLVFYALAIRIPLFPLHGWLPVTAEHGTVAVAPVFLLGLKTGVYGLMRFVFPLMPDAVLFWDGYVAVFAVAGIFYAALLALVQVNLRRLLAYAVVSHTSLLVIGLFSLSRAAFEGGLMLTVNFGLAISGLLMMTGLVFRRTHSTLLFRLGGLFDHMHLVGIAFLVAGLSIIGMPGTPGFDAVHLVLEAAIERFGAVLTIMAALGNVIAAGFLLWAFQRAFLAPAAPGVNVNIAPTRILERIIAVIFLAIMLVAGFHLEPWLLLVDKSLDGVSALYANPHTAVQ